MPDAWKPGLVRLFASHLAEHCLAVSGVAEAMEPYGFGTFVAHQTIGITTDWRNEIERALAACDCMVVFAHPAFHESDWTDQEFGWALGRGVPIVVVAYPGTKLLGFVEKYQAIVVPDSGMTAPDLARQITESFIARDDFRGRVIDGLISALGYADSYVRAGTTAEMLDAHYDELRRSDMIAILHAHVTNHEVGEATLARRPLRRLVEKRAPDLLAAFFPGDGS